MTQGVVGDAGHSDDFGGSVHGFLAFEDGHDFVCFGFEVAVFPHAAEHGLHVGDHGDFPVFSVFGAGFGIALDTDFLSLEINVRPADVLGFADAESAVGQEADQVGTVSGESSFSVVQFMQESVEDVRFR